MITMEDYRRKTEPQWIGTRVRLNRPSTTNGGTEFPAGTLATIIRKYKGFEVRSDPCPHCGVRVQISKIHPHGLDVI